MNKIHLYLVLYSFIVLMILDTVFFGFQFSASNSLYVLTNVVMLTFICLWLLRTLPLLVISQFYWPYVAKMKAEARVKRGGGAYTPFVSVIIPAYNEEVGIVSTLKTLLASTYRNMEILIIDDGSSDRTGEKVRTFIKKYRHSMSGIRDTIEMRYYHKPNGGKGDALNVGIAKSQGEIVCTFDADGVVSRECVERFVSYFVDPSIAACAGNIKIGNREKVIGVIQYLEYLYGFTLKKAEAMFGTVLVIGGAASAFRKNILDELGGYNSKMLTEDMELSFKIQHAGMRIFYAHDACVYTEGPSTWKGLRKQRVRWKRGRVECMYAYRSSLFSRKLTNKRFFWIVLPWVFIQDVELVLCSIFTVLVYLFCFSALNFTPILATIILTSLLYSQQFLQEKLERSWYSFALAPLTWFLFHFTVLVEIYALIVAYVTFWTGRKVTWQKWSRQGVLKRS